MDNEYNAYEQEEPQKKFKITRGMIILAIAILLVIVIVVIIIVTHNANKPKEITVADCKELEDRMHEEAVNYVDEISPEVTRVELDELRAENGGPLESNALPALNICNGYVNVFLDDSDQVSDAYITCENGYETKGYVEGDGGDITKPEIKLKGNSKITIKVGDKFTDPGATATDDVDGDLTQSIVVTGKVNTKKAGTYTLKYSVEDSSGNKASKKRTVIVEEKETTTTTTTTTTTAYDDEDETTTRTTTRKTARATTRATTKKATTARPTTRATTKRITTPPTITLKGNNPDSVTQGRTYVDPGFTAKDATGKNITSKVTKKGTVNTSVAKTYYITYSVTDDYKNTASVSRTVKVVAQTNVTSLTLTPNSATIKVGKTQKLYVNATYTGGTPIYSWKSNNASVATVSSDGIVTGKSAGTATITVTAGTMARSCSIKVTN